MENKRNICIFADRIGAKMDALAGYSIDLKNMQADLATHSYRLEKPYFAALEVEEMTDGGVDAVVQVRKRASDTFELSIQVDGWVAVPCDRCLDAMEQPVSGENTLRVKFGDSFQDDGDDLIVVAESEGTLNVAWLMYEVIALAVPIRHVHPDGSCNADMMKVLSAHIGQDDLAENAGASDPEETDERWNELRKLLNNN